MFTKTAHTRITLAKVAVGDRLSTTVDEAGLAQAEKGDGEIRTVAEIGKRKADKGEMPGTLYTLVFDDGTVTEPRYGTTSHYRVAAADLFTGGEEVAPDADPADVLDAELAAELEIVDEPAQQSTPEPDLLEQFIAAGRLEIVTVGGESGPSCIADAGPDQPDIITEPDPAPLPPVEKRPKAAKADPTAKPEPKEAGPRVEVTLDLSVSELALLYATMGRFGWREFDTWGSAVAPFDPATGEAFPEPPTLPEARVEKLLAALTGHRDWLAKQAAKGKAVNEDLDEALRMLHARIDGQAMAARAARPGTVAPDPVG